MAPKTKTREEVLQKKREAERLRRLRIKQNPVLYEQEKKKDHERYLKKKIQKKVLPIGEISERMKRKQRKVWRESKRRSRHEQKKREELERNLRQDTPPDSDDEMAQNPRVPLREGAAPHVNSRAETLKKIRARNRKKRSIFLIKQRKQIDKLKLKVKMYQKRYQRLKKREKTDLGKKVNNILQSGSVEISRNLLLGEALKEQLKHNYLNLSSEKGKQLFTNMICGKILKKYRLLTRCKSFTNRRQTARADITSRKSKTNRDLREKIKIFLEEDEHTRICPGKKEFVRKGNEIQQKRFLNDTLKNLHSKFNTVHPEYQCGYTLFWHSCPFYVKRMRTKDRDTCLCVTHANMEYVIMVLAANNIIIEKSPKEVIISVCCSFSVECLLRYCSICKGKNVQFANIAEKEISYMKWTNEKEKIFCKKSKKEKVITKVIKKAIQINVTDLIKKFNEMLPKFLSHEGKILHQYNAIRTLKSNLKDHEVLIHMDFSENFATKYSQEIQSFHFGASRNQITLHTVIVYSRFDGDWKRDCYCTLSSSLAHNVPAIWAHLFPILQTLPCTVTTLHFLSDSPTTQYRNKMMFYFLAKELKKYYPGLSSFTWNYSEAGHGKGAPDGIGGTCKRTADRFINCDNDVTDVSSLLQILEQNCKGIRFFKIEENDIEKVASTLPTSVQLFKGTMEVHQVVSGDTFSKLYMRKLSCFQCQNECTHFSLGVLEYDPLREEDLLNIFENNLAGKVNYSDVYSSSDSSSVSCSDCEQIIKKGTFVLAMFPGTKGRKYRYVSLCIEDTETDNGESEIKVVSLKSINRDKTKFKLLENDESYIKDTQLVRALTEPRLVIDKENRIYEFPKPVDVYEL